MLKVLVPPLQGLLPRLQVTTVPAKERTVAKARAKGKAKAQEIIRLERAHIVTSITLQKLGIFLTADHYQVKNASLLPTRAMAVTSALDTRNPPLG